MKILGIVITTLGALSALGGLLLQLIAPGPDANIGAGILVVIGLPVAVIGIVILVISALLRRRNST